MQIHRFALAAILGIAPLAEARQEATPADLDGIEFFEARIRPVLVERCYSCHGAKAEKVKGGLLLDTREGILKGGISGPAIVPGDPERSRLIRAVRRTDEDLQMPPKKALPAEQVADLEAWVKRGAPDPRTPASASTPDRSRPHWAFLPVKDPTVPAVQNKAWVRSPIDHFILAKLEEKGLRPAPPADRRTLIRRATIDLTGLPPTPAEFDAFEKDPAPDAFAKVVDRLLASPRYGERWGRHWLDVARYADTKGYAFEERRFAYSWGYRDWVIRAFNQDLPYDRFLLLQIAAEQLVPSEAREGRVEGDPRDMAAMGFLTIGRKFLNNTPDIIDDRLDVVFRGTQALTIGCARCHDHKYDPIPTKDYYSLYGVMASSREPEELPLPGPAPETASYRAYEKERGEREEEARRFLETRGAELLASLKTPDELARYLRAAHEMRGLHENDVKPEGKRRKLNPAVLARWWWHLREAASGSDPLLSPWHALAAGAELPAGAHPEIACAVAEKRPASLDELAPFYAGILATRVPEGPREELFRRVFFDPARWLKNLFYPDGGPVERAPENPAELLFDETDRKKLGELRKKAKELEFTHAGAPARPMILEDLPEPVSPRVFIRGNKATPGDEVPRRFLAVLSGPDRKPFAQGSGRLELARAIASRENPLTARVLVNRVWQHHFGSGLVRTPSDFGLRSEPPSHPELLDWLAARFTEDWSVKSLHRRILLSSAWQQASEGDPAAARADPENALLWRMNPRRLDLESLRDSLLAVAGRLDPAMGGRGVDVAASRRRTVYATINRQALPGLFRTFDFALPDTHAPQRTLTTVPQQALFMMNSPFVLDQARALADQLREIDAARRIERLHRLLFGRAPTPREVELGRTFVEVPELACGEDCDCGTRPAPLGPWEKYAQVLLQSNEFIYVD